MILGYWHSYSIQTALKSNETHESRRVYRASPSPGIVTPCTERTTKIRKIPSKNCKLSFNPTLLTDADLLQISPISLSFSFFTQELQTSLNSPDIPRAIDLKIPRQQFATTRKQVPRRNIRQNRNIPNLDHAQRKIRSWTVQRIFNTNHRNHLEKTPRWLSYPEEPMWAKKKESNKMPTNQNKPC